MSDETREKRGAKDRLRLMWVAQDHYVNGDGFVSIVNLKPVLSERHRKLAQRNIPRYY